MFLHIFLIKTTFLWLYFFSFPTRYPAKILQVDEKGGQIQIHFEGWNSRYDEWVHYNTPKLRPLVRMSNRKDGFKETPAGVRECLTIDHNFFWY